MTAIDHVGIAASSPLFLEDGVPSAPLAAAVSNAAGPSFADMVSDGLAGVNRSVVEGEASIQRLAGGEVQNIHQVMIQLEESRLSFQLMMQVRSRLLEAYQDVMKMQVRGTENDLTSRFLA